MKNLKSKIENLKSKRVLIGMSGGVDSSVAATILKKQNYEVIGVFLKFTRIGTNECTNKLECNNKCCDYESLLAARQVANRLKIPFYVLDASKVFKKDVVDYFIKEYDSGRTPNPCVVCNKKIKFGWMLEQAKKLGCDYVATGHYSRVAREIPNPKSPCFAKASQGKQFPNNFQFSNNQFSNNSQLTNHKSQIRLFQAKDKKKDQSYFLWQLSQDQLAHILFPIGNYTKEEVRQMARKWKLPTADKRESQDLCFISTADKADFIANYVNKLNKPGDIVDINGKILGQHRGLCYYTVGQREGLGIQLIANRVSRIADQKNDSSISLGIGKQLTISNKQTSSFQPAYVIRLDVERNQLIVGFKKELNSFGLIAKEANFLRNTCLDLIFESRRAKLTKYEKINCEAKIRYGATLVNCHIAKLPNCYNTQSKNNVTMEQCNNVTVKFDQPQKAVTPGQSIVFYNQEELIGGGVIEKSF